MDYFEMSVAYVLVLFAHTESSEIRPTFCILENQKELSSEKKNTEKPPLLGNSKLYLWQLLVSLRKWEV